MAGRPRKTAAKPTKTLEQQLWDTADALRGNQEPSEYKPVVLGLVFLNPGGAGHGPASTRSDGARSVSFQRTREIVMTETTIRASGKVAAASAAKAMLADRVKLVESLGDAHDQHRREVAAQGGQVCRARRSQRGTRCLRCRPGRRADSHRAQSGWP